MYARVDVYKNTSIKAYMYVYRQHSSHRKHFTYIHTYIRLHRLAVYIHIHVYMYTGSLWVTGKGLGCLRRCCQRFFWQEVECIFVCVCACVCACVFACVYVCVYTYTRGWLCIHAVEYVCVYMYARVDHVYMYDMLYMDACDDAGNASSGKIYVCKYLYLRVYMYVYIYIRGWIYI
jgi:hypothetical protein